MCLDLASAFYIFTFEVKINNSNHHKVFYNFIFNFQMLFVMLEEVAHQVSSSQQNLHILHALIQELQKRLVDYLSWGTKLGSELLWKQHSERLEHISTIATTIEIQPVGFYNNFTKNGEICYVSYWWVG